jgi:hypothetical protein
MPFENLLARLLAETAKSKAEAELLSQHGPPSRSDILHDGLVGVGKTWGGILGTTAGIMGGEAVGGPLGAIVGGAVLGPTGALAGGWGAHGAYFEGQLIQDILSHPEYWTVDAAGAIVPATQGSTFRSNENGSIRAGAQLQQSSGGPAASNELVRDSAVANGPAPSGQMGPVGSGSRQLSSRVFDAGAGSSSFNSYVPQNAPGGLPGLMASVMGNNPSNPMQEPPPGGLLGLIQEVMRHQALESGNR